MARHTVISRQERDSTADGGKSFDSVLFDAAPAETDGFDWSQPLTSELALAIARFGDSSMRMSLLSHRSCTLVAVAEIALSKDPVAADAALTHPLLPTRRPRALRRVLRARAA